MKSFVFFLYQIDAENETYVFLKDIPEY